MTEPKLEIEKEYENISLTLIKIEVFYTKLFSDEKINTSHSKSFFRKNN